MRTTFNIIRPLVLTLLALANFMTSIVAQEVSIPDPGLNAAIRVAMHKPGGPLTEQDLLTLKDLNASRRNVRSLEGLKRLVIWSRLISRSTN